MAAKNKVVDFYTNIYDEAKRLGEDCDNRHIVERTVKLRVLESWICRENDTTKTVCEIGAGTGLYCFHFAKKGYNVVAFDIVPKHVRYINKKAKELKLPVKAYLLDISKELPDKFKKDKFKFNHVLLSGPLYHLKTPSQKKTAILNAERMWNGDGFVFVDWLSEQGAYINDFIFNRESRRMKMTRTGHIVNSDENIFSYDNIESMSELIQGTSLSMLETVGTDGMTRLMKDEINKLDKKELKEWINYIYINYNKYKNLDIDGCGNPLTDISEHCISIYY